MESLEFTQLVALLALAVSVASLLVTVFFGWRARSVSHAQARRDLLNSALESMTGLALVNSELRLTCTVLRETFKSPDLAAELESKHPDVQDHLRAAEDFYSKAHRWSWLKLEEALIHDQHVAQKLAAIRTLTERAWKASVEDLPTKMQELLEQRHRAGAVPKPDGGK